VIDLELLLDAVRSVESGGNPRAVSRKGASGPYQFMPDTAKQYGVADPFDEVQSRAGAKLYLQDLYHKFGDTKTVLAAWNWGPGNVDDKGLEAAPRETRDFISRVMAHVDEKSKPVQPVVVAPDSGLYPPQGAAKPSGPRAGITSLYPSDEYGFKNSVIESGGTTPDKAARVLRLQQRTGLPTDLIERNLDNLEADVQNKDFNSDAFRKNSPLVARWMAQNPNHAALAKNDVELMSGMEKFWAGFRALGPGFEEGWRSMRSTTLNYKHVVGDITPAEEQERVDLKKWLEQSQSGFSSGWPSWMKQGAYFVGQQLPMFMESSKSGVKYGLPLGAAAGGALGLIGGPGAPATVPAGAAAGGLIGLRTVTQAEYLRQGYQEAVGEAWDDLEGLKYANGEPVDPTVLKSTALLVALPVTMLDMFSFETGWGKSISDKLRSQNTRKILVRASIQQILKSYAKQHVVSAVTEGTTEGLQKLVVILAGDIAKGEGLSLSDQDIKGAVAEGLMAFKGAAMVGIPGYFGRAVSAKIQVNQAQRSEAFMRGLGESMQQSTMQKNSPEAMRSFVEMLKKGGPVQDVYIPVNSWDALFQSDAKQAAREVFGDDKQYTEASVTGGDLVIPVEDYAAKIAGTEFHESLLPNLRLDPGGLSVIEAAQQQMEVAAEAEQLKLQTVEDVAHEDALGKVYQDVYDKALSAGQSKQAAERDALLWQERTRSRAERLGGDPWQLYRESAIGIRFAENAGTAGQLLQSGEYRIQAPTPNLAEMANPAEVLAEHRAPPVHQVEMILSGMPDEKVLQAQDKLAQQVSEQHNTLANSTAGEVGATFNLLRGNMLGREAFTASVMPERAIRIVGRELNPALVNAFVKHNWDLLSVHPELSVGSWFNPDDGYTYLDVVGTPEARDAALNVAQNRGWFPLEYSYTTPWYRDYGAEQQYPNGAGPGKAVFDLKRMERIPLPQETAPKQGELFPAKRGALSAQELQTNEVPPGTYATHTKLVQESTRVLGVRKVTNTSEAATAFSYLAPTAVERFDALVTDKNGKPLAVVGAFKGALTQASVYPATLAAEAYRIKGAANIWLAHNHPSGVAEFSLADLTLHRAIVNVFRGSGVEVRGLFALSGGTEAGGWVFEPATRPGEYDRGTVMPQKTATTVPVLERVYSRSGSLGPPINSPAAAKRAARTIAGGRPGVILLDTQHIPTAFMEVDPEALGTLRGNGRMDSIYRAVSLANAGGSIIVDAGTMVRGSIANLAAILRTAGAPVLDVVSPTKEVGFQGTWAERGIMPTVEANTFYQPTRGMFSPQSRTITLLRTADASTFLHESAHAWLEDFQADAQRPDSPQQLHGDWQAVREWLGATEETITREQHEQFARGMEAYVMEGKAPSLTLRGVFRQLKSWLTRIYRSATMLDVEINDSIRQVFDRMLATDAEIAEAHDGGIMIFPEGAMTTAEHDAYMALHDSAIGAAEDKLRGRVMRALRAENTAAYKDRYRDLTKSMAADISTQPVYRALYWLQHGTLPDGTVLPGIEAIKLDRNSIPEQLREALPRDITRASNGISPSVVAEMFGFANSDELLQALASAKPLKNAVKDEVKAHLDAEFGEVMTPEGMQEQVASAMANEWRIKLYTYEMRMLTRIGASRKTVPENVMKSLAKSIIGEKSVRDVNSRVFEAAMLRAGREADELISTDVDAAFDAKQRQLLNLHLMNEAAEARDEIDKAAKGWAKTLFKKDDRLAKSRNMDMVNAARAIAASHGIGKSAEMASYYLRNVKQYDPHTYEMLADTVDLVTSDNRPYDRLTVDEFSDMRDAIDGLWAVSRSVKQIEIAGKRIELSQAVDELTSHMADIGGDASKLVGYNNAVSKWDKTKMGMLGVRAFLRRTEHWVDAMDGGEFRGPFRTYMWNPISTAADQFRDARVRYMQKFLELTKGIEKSLTRTPIAAPEIGYEFAGKAELLGALLHTGNDSNLQKLLRGRGWGEFTQNGELDTSRWDTAITRLQSEGVLTKADYDFVQGVWNLFDELKPSAQKTHKNLYGFYFSEVTARPFDTPWGTYDGGYIAAQVDPFVSRDAALRQEQAAVEEQPAGFMFPTVPRGFTKRRIERYAAPLALDLGRIPSNINATLRFIHLAQPVQDVGKIVLNRNFDSTLYKLDSAVSQTMLVPWLQRSGRQITEITSTTTFGRMADDFFREMRRRVGTNILTASVTNALQQFTGISSSATQVPPRQLASALWQYIRKPHETAADIAEKSMFMRTRTTAQVAEIRGAIDNILLNPSKWEKARDFAQQHGYIMQTGTQNVVDTVTWLGAYESAVAGGASENEAIMRGDSAVRETQGTYAPEDISRFEVSTPMMRMFTMFYTYFNMSANLNATEFSKAAQRGGFHGAGRAFYVYLFGLMIPAVLNEAIVRALGGELFDDKDDDGYLDNILSLFFNGQARYLTAMLPILGPTIMAGINKFNSKWYDDRIATSPAISVLDSVTNVPFHAYKLATEDSVRLKRPIQDTLTAIGLATGYPIAPLGRPLGYLSDVEQGYVEPESEADFIRGLITGKAGK